MTPRNLLGMPYRLARLPLTVLDQRVMQRLADDSAPRLLFDRAVGTYDYLAGQFLADPAVRQRGSDRMARVAALAEATELEQQAAAARAVAHDAVGSGKQQAETKRAQARSRTHAGVQDAERTEREGREQAAVRAREAAARRKGAAEARKQQRVDAADRRARSVETAADDRVRKAQGEAKQELADVARTRRTAAADRTDADQLDELAAAKRARRRG